MAEANEEKKEKKTGRVRGFFREFRKFLSRGNILDLAVGVIIGGAFSKIVTSLTNDIIMPLITMAMGKNSISELSVVLRPAEYNEAGELVSEALLWNWGNFLQTIIDFIIIAFVVFLIIKTLMGVKKMGERVASETQELVVKVRNAVEKNGAKDENAAGQENSAEESVPPAEGKSAPEEKK